MLMQDKTKKRILWISISTIISVAIIALVICGFFIIPNTYQKPLEGVRPEECLIKPVIPEKVDDVRITVVERDCLDKRFNYPFTELQPLQMYYGYCIDGVWYDYPSENYDIIGLKWGHGEFGYGAAGDSNFVILGDKVLIAMRPHSSDYAVMKDTLESEVYEITEYYSEIKMQNDKEDPVFVGEKYAFLKENALALETEEYQYNLQSAFYRWYYVVVDIDDINEDYKLYFYETGEDKDIGSSEADYIFTYEWFQFYMDYIEKENVFNGN